jgi:hypothetical protein
MAVAGGGSSVGRGWKSRSPVEVGGAGHRSSMEEQVPGGVVCRPQVVRASRGGAGRCRSRWCQPSGRFACRSLPPRAGGKLGGGGRWRNSEVGGGDLCSDGRQPVQSRGREELGGSEERNEREKRAGAGFWEGGGHAGAGLWGKLGQAEVRSSI